MTRQEHAILRLELPTPYPVGDVNAYFIDGARPALVDTGVCSSRSLGALEEQLRGHGRRLDEIRRILVTHDHYDHAGAALHLSRECGAVLFLHERSTLLSRQPPEAMERLSAFLVRCGVPADVLKAGFEAFRKGARFADFDAKPHAVERLRGGESIDLGDRTLEVLATPGHSPDHLCFLDAAAGIVFCGDMLLGHITPNPLLSLDPRKEYRRNRSLIDYLGSLTLLEARPLRRGYAGHGPLIDDIPALIAVNRAFIERRKGLFLEKISGGIAVPCDLVRAVFGHLDPMNQFLGISETVAHLDLLELDGSVRVDWEGEAITIEAVKPGARQGTPSA